MSEKTVSAPSSGVNQSGLRAHNERLLLSMIQRHGGMPGSDLARRAGLSPQTVSVILRSLERDGLLVRRAPQRGRVGKPSIPMTLAADGVFSIGLKIGRRSLDLLLMDFTGVVRRQLCATYRYPLPDKVFSFLRVGLRNLGEGMSFRDRQRICGLGIAAPFEIWKWTEELGASVEEFSQWKDIDFADEIATFSDLPVYLENDATAACRAEHLYGRGKEFHDYGYFFMGAFVGGGAVLNHSVYEGRQGNAGAFGALPMAGGRRLIETASIYLLEAALAEAGKDPARLWLQPQDWTGFSAQLDPWLDRTAGELAQASLAVCSVIDFEAILIDGGFPISVRRGLVERIRNALDRLDMRGLIKPRIEEGSVGGNARAIGAASGPIFSQFFLNTHVGLGVG